jgi:inosine-uridine nucleoside N-ribohydrolase
MSLPVVPVVDTGVDDALALVIAARHPRLRLVGVVCTAGNVRLDQVIANTAYVLDLLGARVPLATGAARRMDGADFAVRTVHGCDGLAGLSPGSWPVPPARDQDAGAGELAGPGELAASPASVAPPDAVVVSLGPLTSLVGMPPRRIVASYARPGEANYEMDPAAAEQVFADHVALEHAGVGQVAEQVNLTRRPSAVPATASGDLPRLVDGLLTHQARRGAWLGDAAVMLWLAEPNSDPAGWVHCVRSLAAAAG